MKKKLFTVVLSSSILLSGALYSREAKARDYTEEIEESEALATLSEAQIEQLEGMIEELNTQEADTEAQLDELEVSISANETELQEAQDELENSQGKMKALLEEIQALENNIEKRTDKLKKQARVVQVDGQTTNYIDFILGAESISDVFGRVDVVLHLVQSNKKIVDEQIEDKKAVEEKSEEVEQNIYQQNTLAANLENRSAELSQQKLEQEVLLAQFSAEKASTEEEKILYILQREEAQKRVDRLTEEHSLAAAAAEEAESGRKEREGTEGEPGGSKVSSSIKTMTNDVLGTPYLWAGTSTNGFDCSGFTTWVFSQLGISLPRTAAAQYAASTKVSDPQPGDLVFFGAESVTHVGIYAGNGKYIGSQSSTGVAYAEAHSGYWGDLFIGYGRY